MTERFDLYSVNVYIEKYNCFLSYDNCLYVYAEFNTHASLWETNSFILHLLAYVIEWFDSLLLPQIIDDFALSNLRTVRL